VQPVIITGLVISKLVELAYNYFNHAAMLFSY